MRSKKKIHSSLVRKQILNVLQNFIVLGSPIPMDQAGPSVSPFKLGLSVVKVYNHEENAWDEFSLLALLCTRQTRIQHHLPNLATI